MPIDDPRPEYPRPQFRRERWQSLNGPWRFAFDDGDTGVAAGWWRIAAEDLTAIGSPFDRSIVVPFCYQADLSGVGESEPHELMWYARVLPSLGRGEDEQTLLHFGAVDYEATVWLNGMPVAQHNGGHTPFSVDITSALVPGDNVVIVRAADPRRDLGKPRGKQTWEARPAGILYTPTAGIWQSVWLEPVPRARLDTVTCTSDLASDTVTVDLALVDATGLWCEIEASFDGQIVARVRARVAADRLVVPLRLGVDEATSLVGESRDGEGIHYWSPESPHLYDLRIQLLDPDGRCLDSVDSYFGHRSIDVRNGHVRLNGRPYYQRLILDQGYWPAGLMTAPTDDDLRRDIELVKEMGFNGVRKHQKVEDPRWLYWADVLGLLVWSEMPSGYDFSSLFVERLVEEWLAVVRRDRGHPSIVVWVPMNESWGVADLAGDARQRAFIRALYQLTHAVDGTRPVVSNDGWEHADTDLITLHDYRASEVLESAYIDRVTAVASRPGGRAAFVDGSGDRGQPVLLTEFGGISLASGPNPSLYREVADADDLLTEYRALVTALRRSSAIDGYCYTQLTDVEQETNGLLTMDRSPKVALAAIRAINESMEPVGDA
jgi:beta-galactosidase/beta-glucuronidase